MGLESNPDGNDTTFESMRDQDWENLGTVVDLDTDIPWESLSTGSSVVSSDSQTPLPLTSEVAQDDYDISWMGASKSAVRSGGQFIQSTGDIVDAGFENSACWAPPLQRSTKRPTSPDVKYEATCIQSNENSLSSDDESFSQDAEDDLPLIDDDSDSYHTSSQSVFPSHSASREDRNDQSPQDSAHSSGRTVFAGSLPAHQLGISLFPLHLFVTAIADGSLAADTPEKTMAILEQIQRKVSKEQNTIIQVKNEGSLDLKMRVFALNSIEARALGDYIDSHATQVPSPFVVLAREVSMAVPYDPALTDPSQPSVADRLRKQIKTHAVKVLRDIIGDMNGMSTGMLRYVLEAYLFYIDVKANGKADQILTDSGQNGAMAPAELIEPVIQARGQILDKDSKRKYIVLPVKRRSPQEEAAYRNQQLQLAEGQDGNLQKLGRGHRLAGSSPIFVSRTGSNIRKGGELPYWQREQWGAGKLMIPSGPRSPDTSAPSTPGTPPPSRSAGLHLDDDEVPDARHMAHFPVNLFVTAIADGTLARDTPPKGLHRLTQIVRKVPKEQNTSVEVADGGNVDLKMRVFVVNSEDAKAVSEYIQTHPDQIPAPFVVLARQLPMAVMYDPASLDLSDASVADRLRKQAKTRAVKVLRESIGNRALGITMAMLRGHLGATAPGDCLQEYLLARTECVDGDPNRRGILFVARNKGSSAPSSPRKRATPDGPDGGNWSACDSPQSSAPSSPSASAPPSPSGSGSAAPFPSARSRAMTSSRRTGASSASHLHRDMLDKAFKKRRVIQSSRGDLVTAKQAYRTQQSKEEVGSRLEVGCANGSIKIRKLMTLDFKRW